MKPGDLISNDDTNVLWYMTEKRGPVGSNNGVICQLEQGAFGLVLAIVPYDGRTDEALVFSQGVIGWTFVPRWTGTKEPL